MCIRDRDRFNEVCAAFAEPDADFDALMAEQSDLQSKIDAAGAWDLERTFEIAMDALRLPPGDAEVATLSGGERRRVALCRLDVYKRQVAYLGGRRPSSIITSNRALCSGVTVALMHNEPRSCIRSGPSRSLRTTPAA